MQTPPHLMVKTGGRCCKWKFSKYHHFCVTISYLLWVNIVHMRIFLPGLVWDCCYDTPWWQWTEYNRMVPIVRTLLNICTNSSLSTHPTITQDYRVKWGFTCLCLYCQYWIVEKGKLFIFLSKVDVYLKLE